MATATTRRAGSTSHVWGYVIVLAAAAAFIASMYAMVFSKLLLLLEDDREAAATVVMPTTDQSPSLLLALERDVYYCYLVPLTIPVTILACYANWVSLKFFRHN
ncbi:phosphatidylinositol N-acetylglucosaminyltransferase subunit Y-domain-containing protein [Phytophthora cinnamomi]|uniref:phosphatidylinositol N-acetylglucosaminyltransferase subunit Y-domain-containing protein n=1 Tax=Phytophthora cinnamomi TaxID=4785 RepID=UPI003559886A|nr:phosphatidylinositol N-acetylglucosaminyltransferase subunit Y-domain-containing protein [Phytophthora cinnamomi]